MHSIRLSINHWRVVNKRFPLICRTELPFISNSNGSHSTPLLILYSRCPPPSSFEKFKFTKCQKPNTPPCNTKSFIQASTQYSSLQVAPNQTQVLERTFELPPYPARVFTSSHHSLLSFTLNQQLL